MPWRWRPPESRWSSRRLGARGWDLLAWLSPVIVGALFVGALVAVTLLAFAPWAVLFGEWRLVVDMLRTVGYGLLLGGTGGLFHAVVGRPVRRLGGRAGPYLAGMVTFAGYVGAMFLFMPHRCRIRSRASRSGRTGHARDGHRAGRRPPRPVVLPRRAAGGVASPRGAARDSRGAPGTLIVP